MNELFRNKLLCEYTRDELVDEYLIKCKAIDQKTAEIEEIDKQIRFFENKAQRQIEDIEDQNKQQVVFDGTKVPTATKSLQHEAKELQKQIEELNMQLLREQAKKDSVLREVEYFRSLLNFPGHRAKAALFNGKPQGSKDLLIKYLSDILSSGRYPKFQNQIQASIALLNHNFKDAEGPMRSLLELIGGHLPIFDILDLEKEIEERRKKIEELRQRLAELKAQHDQMTKEHQKMLKQFQDEADLNNQRYRELMDLQHDKEEKEAEAARLHELEIILNGIQKEIDLLKKQVEGIGIENKSRIAKLKDHFDEQLKQMRAELQALKDFCDTLRNSNSALQKKLADLEAQYQAALERRKEIEDGFQLLQEEYRNLRDYFIRMMSATDMDPFENQEFCNFIQQMIDKEWGFVSIRHQSESIDQLKSRRDAIEGKISKYEKLQSKLKGEIASKQAAISQLEQQMRGLMIGDPKIASGLKVRTDYKDGAPHINFTPQQIATIGKGQVAVMISFREFTLHQFDGEKSKVKLFLVVDFLEHKSITTRTINFLDGNFDTNIMFLCNNDYQLKDYLSRKTAEVELFKVNGQKFASLAKAHLDLSLLVANNKLETNSFSAKTDFFIHESSIIGNVDFEAQLYGHLLD